MQENDFVPSTPQERLLAAVLEILEEENPGKMTTRAIAAEAGVNSAAINYYYRSKESLIDAALSSSWNHTLAHIHGYLDSEPWDPRRVFHDVGVFLLEGGFSHPVVTRTMFFDGKGNPRIQTGDSVAELTRELADRLSEFFPRSDPAVILRRIGAFVSSLVFPALIPTSQPWLKTREDRAVYLESLIDTLMSGVETEERKPGS